MDKHYQEGRFGDDPSWAERLMVEYNSTIQELGKNIDKAFELSRGRIGASCSALLKGLDVSPIAFMIFKTYREEWRYRHNPKFMLKAAMFMRLKGLKFQSGLASYLQKNPADAENLGCTMGKFGKPLLPARRTFNYFMGERLTKDILGLIDFTAWRIRETAANRGVVLDFAVGAKPKKSVSDRTFYRKKSEKLRETTRLMRRQMYPMVKLELGRNSTYRQEDFLDMLTHVALTHDFTENGSNTYAYQRKGRAPTADTLLYHMKKYGHRKAVEGMYDRIFDATIEMARKAGFLSRPLDLAIDMTDIMYYGDKCDYMVVGTKPTKGTCYAFKFATVTAVLNGERFILYVIPVGKDRSTATTVRSLLEFVKGKVSISRIYLDRGFSNTGVIEYLNGQGIKFVMPAVKSYRIKEIMRRNKAPYITDYRMVDTFMKGRAWMKLVLLKGKEGKCNPDETYAFVTNIEGITSRNASMIQDFYDRRWGIETAFRVKEAFRARTTSKNYIIRLFYFLFSVTLYNLWVMVNTLISLSIFGKLPDKPLVTAKLFGTMLYNFSCIRA